MQLLKKIGTEKFYVLSDQIVVSGTSFLTNLILAKALGLEQFGIFSGAALVQFFCLTISMGLTTQVFQVLYPTFTDKLKKSYTASILILQALFLILIIGLGVAFLSFIPTAFVKYQYFISYFIIALCLFLLQDAIRKILLTQLLFKQTFIADTITNGLQLLLLLIFWKLDKLNIKTAWLIIGLTFIPSTIYGLIAIKFSKPTLREFVFSVKKQKQNAGWMLSSNLLQWLTGYFFVIAAGWWIGAAALGALRLAQYLFGLLNVVLQAIENYALPKYAGLKNNKQTFLFILLKKMLLLMLPVLLLLSVFAKQILLFTGGANYVMYSYVMYGLSIIYIFITIGYPVRIAIRSHCLNKQYFKGYIFSAIFSLLTAYWLLKNLQLAGVLIGLLITQLITIGYWLNVLQKNKIILWKSFTLF